MQSTPMSPTVLVVATLDTKRREAAYLKAKIELFGYATLLMDVGVFDPPGAELEGIDVGITHQQVAAAAGTSISELSACGDKGHCIRAMTEGARKTARDLYAARRFQGVIGIGGAQGTDIITKVMQDLPFGVPKLMVSAVATGTAAFGPFVGTKDIMMMHSVADLQGLNFVTTRVLSNAAAAICGMVKHEEPSLYSPREQLAVALSMSGTTTPGALTAMRLLEEAGFEVVAFHQNGSGGIAMEDMIAEGLFDGVLDINLHEIGDAVVGGLHGAVRGYRLESAARAGIPLVVAPGSINYTVQGPLETLSEDMKRRKLIVHNSYLTLVSLSHDELRQAALTVARKLNPAVGPVHVFLPLRGFTYPDRKGEKLWDPEGNQVFIDALKHNLRHSIPVMEVDAHVNDTDFIRTVVDDFTTLIRTAVNSKASQIDSN